MTGSCWVEMTRRLLGGEGSVSYGFTLIALIFGASMIGMNAMLSMPFETVAGKILSIARFAPPACATMSKFESTRVPLMSTLNTRIPVPGQYISANFSVTLYVPFAIGIAYIKSPYRTVWYSVESGVLAIDAVLLYVSPPLAYRSASYVASVPVYVGPPELIETCVSGNDTFTVADALAEPPLPVHVSVYVVVVVGDTVCVPLVALLPLHPPDAVHDVTFEENQERVEDWLEVIEGDDSVRETLGPLLNLYGWTLPSIFPYINGRSGQKPHCPLKHPPNCASLHPLTLSFPASSLRVIAVVMVEFL